MANTVNRGIGERDNYRNTLETGKVVSELPLGDGTSLYTVTRKTGVTMTNVPGPSGVSGGAVIGFSDASGGQHYSPVVLQKGKTTKPPETVYGGDAPVSRRATSFYVLWYNGGGEGAGVAYISEVNPTTGAEISRVQVTDAYSGASFVVGQTKDSFFVLLVGQYQVYKVINGVAGLLIGNTSSPPYGSVQGIAVDGGVLYLTRTSTGSGHTNYPDTYDSLVFYAPRTQRYSASNGAVIDMFYQHGADFAGDYYYTYFVIEPELARDVCVKNSNVFTLEVEIEVSDVFSVVSESMYIHVIDKVTKTTVARVLVPSLGFPGKPYSKSLDSFYLSIDGTNVYAVAYDNMSGYGVVVKIRVSDGVVMQVYSNGGYDAGYTYVDESAKLLYVIAYDITSGQSNLLRYNLDTGALIAVVPLGFLTSDDTATYLRVFK